MKDKYAKDVEEFSMEFNGIAKDRWCTDLPCLILFFVFIGMMGFATVYGF